MLNPGYPYEESLMRYNNATELTMCMAIRKFNTFNWTRGNHFTAYHFVSSFSLLLDASKPYFFVTQMFKMH